MDDIAPYFLCDSKFYFILFPLLHSQYFKQNHGRHTNE